jgi:hypothetical protein
MFERLAFLSNPFRKKEMLELVGSPMHSFANAAGVSFVLRQFADYLYIGVSDTDADEFVSMQSVTQEPSFIASSHWVASHGNGSPVGERPK